jgi:speckle-type POZ protein
LQVPASTYREDFAALLESKEGADVTLEVEGEMMHGHSSILRARSPVYHAMLGSALWEGAGEVVVVEGIRAPAFAAMLYFIYSDSLLEVKQD